MSIVLGNVNISEDLNAGDAVPVVKNTAVLAKAPAETPSRHPLPITYYYHDDHS